MSEYNVDYSVIKKPGQDEDLTPEQASRWIELANDPIKFMTEECWVVGPFGKQLFEPRDYQMDLLDVVIENNLCVVNSPRQSGKRLSLDTIVPTPTGYTTIGDIRVGDKIIGADGNPATVSYLSPIEENPDAYKVTFSTGEEILADAEHLWTVNEKKKGSVTVDTQYMIDAGLTVGNPKKSGSTEKRFSIDTMEPLDLPEADLPIDPYIFGYWLGDGKSEGTYIYIGENQEGDFESFTSYCEENNIPYSVHSPSNDRSVWRVRVHGLYNKLRKLGCRGNKHIPIQYLRASKRQRELLIQGIMDSDGNVSKTRKGFVEITQKSKTLIYDIHELLSSMGTRFSLPKEKVVKQFNPSGEIYYRISGSLYLDDYQPFRLKRKLDLVPQSPHPSRKRSTKKRQIVSIEKVDPVPMRCIQVDNEDHLFCVGRSFIPTHNTQTMALYLLHQAIFKPDFNIGVTSYRLSGCKDIMNRIKYSLEELDWWLKPPVILYNQSEIKFTNGSSIISQVTSDQTFRGRSLHLSLIDEYAHCSLEVQSTFLESFLPSLTAGGDRSTAKAIFISTPRSASGKYAELCFGAQSGDNGFVYHKVDHEKIPYRSEAWKKDKIKQLGMAKYRQEYEGAFLSDSGTLINSIVLESIRTKDPVEVFGDLEIYVDELSGRKLVMGVDSSEGISKDAHCIQLVDATTFEQVGEFTNNTMTQSQYAKAIIRIITMLFSRGVLDVYLAIERNGISMGVIRLLENSEDDNLNRAIFINDVNEMGVATGKTGLTTTNKSKQEGCSQLKDLVESGRMKINGANTVNELRFFVKRGASFAAEAGAKDDRAMALVIVCNALKQVMDYEESVYEALSELDPEIGGEECFDIYF